MAYDDTFIPTGAFEMSARNIARRSVAVFAGSVENNQKLLNL